MQESVTERVLKMYSTLSETIPPSAFADDNEQQTRRAVLSGTGHSLHVLTLQNTNKNISLLCERV